MNPENLKYTQDHEWLLWDGTTATVGITDHAQSQLGDITYIELPPSGKTVQAHDPLAVVESVKAASDVFSPVAGTVLESNSALENSPEQVNTDPYQKGWICKLSGVEESAVKNLMSAQDYDKFLKESA